MTRALVVSLGLAACSAVDAAPSNLPCGDAPQPVPGKVPADTTSTGAASIAQVPDGIVFSFTGHGSFPIPFKTPTSSSSHTQIASTWGYLIAGDKLSTIGELGRAGAGAFVGGVGAALVRDASGYSQCTAGGRKALPATSRKGRLVADALDQRTLLAVFEEATATTKCGPLDVAKERLVSIDTLSLDTAAWSKLAARSVKPSAGAGCRSATIESAIASPTTAALAVKSCTIAWGGDYVSVTKCNLAIDVWSAKGWQSAVLPTSIEVDKVLLSIAGGTVRAAVTSADGKFTVYRVNGTALVAETPAIDGYPLALAGSQLLVGTPDGKRAGAIGIGWRLHVHELASGTWKKAADFIDVDNAHAVAVAWGTRTIVVAPEDQRGKNPVSARVLERANGKWRELPTARVVIAP